MSSMISNQADDQAITTNDQGITTNDDGSNDFENDENYTKAAQYWNSVNSTIDGM